MGSKKYATKFLFVLVDFTLFQMPDKETYSSLEQFHAYKTKFNLNLYQIS